MNQKQIGVIIAIGVAVVALGGAAALAGVGPFGGPGEQGVYDAVPDDAQYVFYADVNGFANDPTTAKVGNHILMNHTEQNMTYEETLSQFEMTANQQLNSSLQSENLSVDVDVQDVGQVVAYGKYDAENQEISENYTAAVFELNITEDEFDELGNAAVDRAEEQGDEVDAEMTTYKGHTIVTINDSEQSASLALLEQGTHVAGTTEAVKDSIDTWEGDNPAVDDAIIPDGTGENTYFGVGLEANEELQTQVEEELNSSPNVQGVTGTYSTDGNNEIFVDLTVTVDTASSADDLAMEFQNNLNETSNQTEVGELQNVNVGADNTDVTVRYNTTTDQINNTIDTFADQFPVQQPPQEDPEPPQDFPEATMTYDYNSDAQEVTVTVDDAGNTQELTVYDNAGNAYDIAAEDGATVTVPAESGDYISVTGTTADGDQAYTVSSYFVP